jgi:hypothetical protein
MYNNVGTSSPSLIGLWEWQLYVDSAFVKFFFHEDGISWKAVKCTSTAEVKDIQDNYFQLIEMIGHQRFNSSHAQLVSFGVKQTLNTTSTPLRTAT